MQEKFKADESNEDDLLQYLRRLCPEVWQDDISWNESEVVKLYPNSDPDKGKPNKSLKVQKKIKKRPRKSYLTKDRSP